MRVVAQVCLSGSRLFIEKSVYDKFMTAFVEKAKELGVRAMCMREEALPHSCVFCCV